MTGPRRQVGRQLPDGGQRLKALRNLLDLKRATDLADRLQIDGLSASTLREIEAPGEPRLLWDYEADTIADALAIERSFFTAPVEKLGDVRRQR